MSYLLLQADARRIPLADGTVHCVVTSPPYFGLRDYGTATWVGGDPDCDHRESKPSRTAACIASSGLEGGKGNVHRSAVFRGDCGRCGAIRADSQIGLEATPDAFVAAMVGVFREVWRVLRADGTLWLNLGDSYANDTKWGGSGGNPTTKNYTSGLGGCVGQKAKRSTGLKPKDLMGVPWRVALALQDDRWYLRSGIVWEKPNAMPEPVKDRPSVSHEYVFLLTKSERYFFDDQAIAEPSVCKHPSGNGYKRPERLSYLDDDGARGNDEPWQPKETRNSRTVWRINTSPYRGAHFATYPPELAQRCVLAGSPRGGVVLDPFNGAATTGVVSLAHGRRYVGLDLNPEYLAMSRRRIERPHAPIRRETVASGRSLFDALEAS